MNRIFSLTTLCILLSSLNAGVFAQNISTIAGTGSATFSGDGGAATLTGISTPGAIARDASGNIYVACLGDNRIRKISVTGTITTIAGTGTAGYSGDGGPASSAQINQPAGIFTDGSGNLYFGEAASHRARKIDAAGIITTIAGNGTAGSSGDGGQATAATLNSPYSVIKDASGNIYILENLGQRVRKINSSGVISTFAGTGTAGFSGDGGPATAAKINRCGFIYVGTSNNLYIVDNGNHRVRKVDASGIINTIAGNGSATFGGDGGPATNASLNYPGGIVIDAAGNIVIADCYNHRIRKIDAVGTISTIAGTGTAGFSGDGGPASAAQLRNPIDLFIDPTGAFVFADMFNNRIRKFTVNHAPRFTRTQPAYLWLCKDSTARQINFWLAISDSEAGQSETWTIVTPPAHGSLGGFSATSLSTGSVVTPAGLTYTSTTGYTGIDSFIIKVSDGTDFDTLHMIVNVRNCHVNVPMVSNSKEGISIVPNPSNGMFNILVTSDSHEYGDVSITDIFGRKVKEFNISGNSSTAMQLNEPPGIYFISVSAKNGLFKTKIVIDK